MLAIYPSPMNHNTLKKIPSNVNINLDNFHHELPDPLVEINPRNLLEFRVYTMAMSGLSPGILGVIFVIIYDPPGQYFINFSNVARQKTLWILLIGPQ